MATTVSADVALLRRGFAGASMASAVSRGSTTGRNLRCTRAPAAARMVSMNRIEDSRRKSRSPS